MPDPPALDDAVGNGNAQLEPGEHAEIGRWPHTGIAQSGDSFTVEVRPAHGMPTTVRRAMPSSGNLPPSLQLS